MPIPMNEPPVTAIDPARPRRRRLFGWLTISVLLLGVFEVLGLGLWWNWSTIEPWFRARIVATRLNDRDPQVRADAASELIAIGGVARDPVCDQLRSGPPRARLEAAILIHSMPSWGERTFPDEIVRTAIDVLSEGHDELLEPANYLLECERAWYGRSIRDLTPIAARLRELVQRGRTLAVREAAASALLTYYDGTDPPTLSIRSRLDDPDPEIAAKVARGLLLGGKDPAAAVEKLLTLLEKEANERRRIWIVEALANAPADQADHVWDRLLWRFPRAGPQERIAILNQAPGATYPPTERDKRRRTRVIAQAFIDPANVSWYNDLLSQPLGLDPNLTNDKLLPVLSFQLLKPWSRNDERLEAARMIERINVSGPIRDGPLVRFVRGWSGSH